MEQADYFVPAVYVSGSPRERDAAQRFAEGIRAYADRLEVAGVVLLASHRHRAGDPPAVVIDVDSRYSPENFALVERTAALLQAGGMATELGWPWPREFDIWSAMQAAHERAPYPVIQVSVPSRFGLDLTVLATRALQPLRRERVLLVGVSSVYADATRRSHAFDDPATEDEIGGIPV